MLTRSSRAPLRLFFGIDLPPAVREHVARWRRPLGVPGAATPTANLHLTLVFLGAVDPADVGALTTLASTVRFAPFEIRLDRLRRWRSGILFLAPARPPRELFDLQAALDAGVRELGYATDERPYAPHLTLARGTPYLERMPSCPSFRWTVDRITLFSSETDVRGAVVYPALGEWFAEGLEGTTQGPQGPQ